MGKVIGLGGLFLISDDPDATREWYQRVLGLEPDDFGGFHFLHNASAQAFPDGARTIFSVFEAGTDYVQPSTQAFMLNLMVDDLDAVLERAAQAGVPQVQDRQSFEYGQFAWIMDIDGRKVELWQPPG